jgi:probable rRNA maturation factor
LVGRPELIKGKVVLKKVKVQNIHPRLRVKNKAIALLVQNILSSERADSGVDVIFVDDQFMRKLNRQFTKKDRTTDVLSFGMRGSQPREVEYSGLGDVYVSLDQAKRQATEYKVRFEDEVALLVAHGLLHLLGYDHQDKRKACAMRKKEEVYLDKWKNLWSLD